MILIEQIKKLREQTNISITECKKALEEANGDIEKAKDILKNKGVILAKKKNEKETGEGIVHTYVHSNKKIGAMIELRCQSDFVARTEDFQKLALELCLQITASDPKEITELMAEPWIRDTNKTIKDLINEYIVKFGENIVVKNFIRYEI